MRDGAQTGAAGTPRSGYSLVELLAVVVLLGVLLAAAAASYGEKALGHIGAEADARRVALDLLQAQRRAIATGDNHFLEFSPNAAAITSYTLKRRASGGDAVVEATRQVPASVVMSAAHAAAEFTFEGQALAAYQIQLAGATRSWTVSVVPVTGAVRVTSP